MSSGAASGATAALWQPHAHARSPPLPHSAAKESEAAGDFAKALLRYEDGRAILPSQPSLEQKIAYLRVRVRTAAPAVAASDSGVGDTGSPMAAPVAVPAASSSGGEQFLSAATHRDDGGDDDDDDDVVAPARRGAPPSATVILSDDEGGEADAPAGSSTSTPSATSAGGARAMRLSGAPPLHVAEACPPLATADSAGLCVVDGYSCFTPEGMATLPGGFLLPRKLFSALYPYQRHGVAWMWSLHSRAPCAPGSLGRDADLEGFALEPPPQSDGARAAEPKAHELSGGVLADDMGERVAGGGAYTAARVRHPAIPLHTHPHTHRPQDWARRCKPSPPCAGSSTRSW